MNAFVRRVGAGPELVWIHGLGEASICFDDVIARMPGWTHVLPDLPGYGRSPWPDEPPSLDALADQLAAWLGTSAPVVIGHSMGGVLALMLAERAPVRAIVNVEGNISRGDCTFSGRAAGWSREDFRARGFGELRDWIFELSLKDRPMRGYYAALAFASPVAF